MYNSELFNLKTNFYTYFRKEKKLYAKLFV